MLDKLRRISTPSFVYDERIIVQQCQSIAKLSHSIGALFLYTLKPLSYVSILELLASEVDGFATSSLFEAKLTKQVLKNEKKIHITTPGFRYCELDSISRLCNYVTFNSLSQWVRYKNELKSNTKYGVRIDPRLSFVQDERYDPCRKHSKLGVPIEQIIEVYETVPERFNGLTGLHFHTNCDSRDFRELLETVHLLDDRLAPVLSRMEWINLGGGYIFDEAKNIDAFYDAVHLLKDRYGLEVFIEPGAAVVRKAGYIVSTVIDLFVNDSKAIALLDTTVNHMPEVFEYQYEPDVLGHDDNGKYSYILAGSSCLVGDKFGEYSFNEPLEIGSRVIFTNAGAYTLTKAHYFNGINLPTIYALTKEGELIKKKEYTYDDYANHCGVNKNVYS